MDLKNCKIVMYHYVRPIKNSLDPKIKGLEIEGFKKQIEYFSKKFRFISAEEVIESIYNNKTLSQNSILLTFDDGFNDHYSHVFPILKKNNIQGIFFPPAEPIMNNKVLDVHKIHFILARYENENEIIKEIFNFISDNKEKFNLKEPKKYFSELAISNRFDTKETIFIKRILQRELPKKVRNELTDRLFNKIVKNESNFANEFYLTFEQIDEMKDEGMFFGSHGYKHEWFTHLGENDLDMEMAKSLEFLAKIKQDVKTICYPYGNFDDRVISKIKKYDYKIGFTTEVGDANLTKEDAFKLKRYDTNDFPQ